MKKVNILYIERFDLGPVDVKVYETFIKSIFNSLNYNAEVHMYCKKPEPDEIDNIIKSKYIDAIFCDITLGSKGGENKLGLETVKDLKENYPEIIVCGISGADITYRMTANHKNIPTFDLFIDKIRHDDEDYKNYIKNEMNRIFCLNVGIDVNTDNLNGKGKKFFEKEKSLFLRLLKRITFTTHESEEGISVQKITLYPTNGGYSSSCVYKMICQTANGEPVINSVIKCSKKTYVLKEIRNYQNYVKWYLPYTWRPEMLSYALGKDFGMICYSFVNNDTTLFSSLTDCITLGKYKKVDSAIEKIFSGSTKQWYSENNCDFIEGSINNYYRKLYFNQSKEEENGKRTIQTIPYNIVEETLKKLGGTIEHERYIIERESFPMVETLFTNHVANKYQQCICHGDLNTNNILLSKGGELIFIDFQDTGKGHVFHDFVVFEMCLRLYQPQHKTLKFNDLLKFEIDVSNNNFSFAKRNSIWPRIQRIRALAIENFSSKDFKSYYLSMAMRAFRLFRAFKNSECWEAKILLAILLANLLKLEKLSSIQKEESK
jgi:hypothetical protein